MEIYDAGFNGKVYYTLKIDNDNIDLIVHYKSKDVKYKPKIVDCGNGARILYGKDGSISSLPYKNYYDGSFDNKFWKKKI